MSISLFSNPFHGSSGSYSYPAYKNTGHWSPRTAVSPLLRFCLILGSAMTASIMDDRITYSGFDQSRPAGQRRAPVTSWLNPRSNLIFLESGGMTACPLGTSHSRTADFRVLVSSPRAPDAPLPSYGHWVRWYARFSKNLLILPREWRLPPRHSSNDLKD
jgi:hypothetical protein